MRCDASTPYYEHYVSATQQLRCPVCDGQRIDSSNAPFALTVKQDVCEYIRQGMTVQDVVLQIEADYGQQLRVSDGLALWPLWLMIMMVLWSGIWLISQAQKKTP